MKLANTLKITVFAKPEEDEKRIKQKLLSLLPFDLEEEKLLLKKTRAKGFKQREIIIFELELEKDRHINAFLKSLNKQLSAEQKRMLAAQDNRIDEDCNFFIRLDKQRLLKHELFITDSGDCYHIRISIAAFPKKKERAKNVVKRIFCSALY